MGIWEERRHRRRASGMRAARSMWSSIWMSPILSGWVGIGGLGWVEVGVQEWCRGGDEKGAWSVNGH